MGSTVTVMWAHGDAAYFGQVGDKSSHLYRNSRLAKSLNHSHKSKWQRVSSPRAAKFSMVRNIITRSISLRAMWKSTIQGPLEVGDHFLLCSDGLTGLADHEFRILRLRSDDDPNRAD